MLKSELLRAAIVAHNPFFKQEPDRLEVYVTKGNILASGTASPSFAYKYELNVLAMDYPGDLDDLAIPLLQWALEYQSELLFNPARRENGISFDAEILNNGTADILFVINASENVIVTRDAAGVLSAVHRTEPKRPDEMIGDWKNLLAVDQHGNQQMLQGGE
ncbi:phage tail protein [Erwinia rhapontici]|uniref:phage tail protein n=1 Tax=Erwinia rhapontici TaxID=55212 RepID=UPI0010E834D3|nr:phage tail protein [Erwinia rhapontici]TDS93414.1 tail completion protein R (GpR) [Erwinia rhapontici]